MKGEVITSSLLMLLGRISSGEERKVTEFYGKEIKIKNMGVGKNIKLFGTLYTPV